MLRAIEAGEAERARSLMYEHLLQGESTLLKSATPAEAPIPC